MKGKGCGTKWSWPFFEYYTSILQKKLKKTMKNLSHESRVSGRDLNQTSQEYKTGNANESAAIGYCHW
jgi:hypothetical protein